MEADAYKLGSLDAVLELGLTKEAWGKAVMPILGSLAGAALAPEGERAQGAMLGGLGALGLQSAAFGKGKGAPAPVAAPAAAPATASKPSMQDVGSAVLAQGKEHIQQWLKSPPTPKPAPAALPSPAPVQKLQPRRVVDIPRKAAPPPPPPAPSNVSQMPRARSWADTYAANQSAQEAAAKSHGVDPALMAQLRQELGSQGLTKKSALDRFKLAIDVGGSIGIPGMGGLGVSLKDQRERLPGMSRWVPRGAVERGFDYADQGFDPEAVMDTEEERGSLLHPGIGAALASAGAAKFAPKSGVGGALLAGLGGAGLGALYHRATGDTRRREGLEAFEGAERERSKFPIRRHPTQTANEASPLAVSRGHGDA